MVDVDHASHDRLAERLRLTLAASGAAAAWEWNLETGLIAGDARFASLYNLTPEQAEKFWPIYREFAERRKEIRSELRNATKGIDKKNPDPKKQQELVDLSLKVKQRVLDLEKDYSGRLLKVVSAEQMLRLPNAEAEFRAYLNDLIQQRRLNQQRRENFREKNQRLQQRN